MRGDTVFRRAVHLIGADLYLKRTSVRSDQRRVQRLIHIRLGHRDIILETAGNRLIHLVDHTERRIAILQIIDKDPDRKQIIDLIDRLSLIDHLFINTEKMLAASFDGCFDTGILNVLFHILYQILHIFISGALSHGHLFHKVIICLRLQIFQ